MLVTDVLIRTISAARTVAFSTLQAVMEGGFASDILAAQSRPLSSRDAGLASQIVFGTLRFQGQLDFLIHYYSDKSSTQFDQPVLIALRCGIFQLRYLERVPPHAAVHESVNFVYSRKRAAAGLVNAVLRKVQRTPVEWPNAPIRLSCPEWLLERWAEHFGEAEAEAIAAAALQEPASFVRIASSQEPSSVILDGSVRPTDVPGAFQVIGQIPEGLRLQDIGSQSILPFLDLQPGQAFLDVCAAPGNKTMQALETSLRLAVACDVSFKRLSTVPAVLPRVVLDGAKPLPFGKIFDRIFVDAPCSGTGTLGRNPEIKWRVQADDLQRFQQRQVALLQNALDCLASDGKLLYATCSLEQEENEDVVAFVLAKRPEFVCSHRSWRLPGREPGDGFHAAVLERRWPSHDKIQGVSTASS